MILDTLENAERYFDLHPLFSKVVEFIKNTDVARLEPGSVEIDGKKLFVNISNGPGIEKDESNVELHKRYIDVQYVISGVEYMGWIAASECIRPIGEYDAENDYLFCEDEPTAWMTVKPGQFAVFFPEDGHQPMISKGNIHKLIFKILAW